MHEGARPRIWHWLSLPPQLMGDLGQVQLEIQKKWRQWHLQEFLLRPMALNSSFSNGTSDPTHRTKASSKVSSAEQSRGTCRAGVI